MSKPAFISYKDFDVEQHLTCTPPEQKTVGGGAKTGKPVAKGQKAQAETKYRQIALFLNLDDKTSEFLMEFPEMEARSGIRSQTNQQDKEEFSVMVALPQSDPTMKLLKEKLDEFWEGCCSILDQSKSQLGSPFNVMEFSDPKMAQMMFKKLVHITMMKDEPTKPDPTRNPTMFLKCFQRGYEKTTFIQPTVDAQGNPSYKKLTWDLLIGAQFKFIPMVRIKTIYIGSKCSIQLEMVSAVLTTPPVDRSDVCYQTDTVQQIAKNEEVVKLIDTGVERIRLTRATPMEKQFTDEEIAGKQDEEGEGEEGTESPLRSNMTGNKFRG